MQVHDTIEISCHVDRLWKETIDVDNWSSWAPTVQSAVWLDREPIGLGSRAAIKQPMQPENIWHVVAFHDGSSFEWETGTKLFAMRALHCVTPHTNGCKSVLGIAFKGPMATLLAPLLWVPIKLAIWQENRGLKKHCEAQKQGLSSPDPAVPDRTREAKVS